jgi:pimeloyl-ACP methyl ester carboxylesterase
MIDATETFDGTWPYAPHFFEGNGFRMHYVDEGAGDTIVCLHGQPTWGYVYRNFIARLASQHRVIVPDQMGFGKSETPQDRSYSTQEHYENFERLLLHLDVQNITLVVQDWGGPIGGSFAYRHPDRVKRLCVCNTVIPGFQMTTELPSRDGNFPTSDWVEWVQSAEFEPTITHLGATVLSVMKRIGFERTAHIDETWIRAYAAQFPSVAECRAALQFPRNITAPETGIFLSDVVTNGDMEAVKALPAMCVYGEADRAFPIELVVEGFKSLWPNGPVVTLPGVGHFVQEDAPEAVTAMIEQFIQMTP